MANGIRTGDPCGFNKGHSSKFREGSRVREIPEEGHIGRNDVEITIKMKTVVRKPFRIKITKLRLRNLDNYYYDSLELFVFEVHLILFRQIYHEVIGFWHVR